MIKHIALAAALLAVPASAQDEPAAAPSPGEIVAQADPSEWVAIAPDDLLVMTLAPARDGKERKVVIQLIPPPFSQPWVANIRTLARAHWWDGLAIVRVQDNYVAQWGDPDGEDPAKARALPEGLHATNEAAYTVDWDADRALMIRLADEVHQLAKERFSGENREGSMRGDPFAAATLAWHGWPIAVENGSTWPIHCYGMVGVGRGMSPDAGTGAELYTVIGHAPRHLDRNIAVVGRVVGGIEHLSSLPRGTGPLGFYETAEERVPIASVRLASELPAAERPKFEYLSTEGETFARYDDARANRRDPFFIVPAGGADICNIPVPVRRVAAE
jgi:peptidylprolyl isomerase